MPAFCRYIGIDYSGAETPESSLKGLRVYCAVGETAACEVALAPPAAAPDHREEGCRGPLLPGVQSIGAQRRHTVQEYGSLYGERPSETLRKPVPEGSAPVR